MKKSLFVALFALGLLIRLVVFFLPYNTGMASVIKDLGQRTAVIGLSNGFQGSYFPIQYLLFGNAYSLSERTGIDVMIFSKLHGLLGEIGIFFLLVFLAKKLAPQKNATPKNSPEASVFWLYWLNPFPITMLQIGFVDSQFAFFALAAMVILIACEGRWKYALAGIPFGIAALMKPQPVSLLFGFFILVAFSFFKNEKKERPWRLAEFLIGASLLFIGFSLYFGFTLNQEGHKRLPVISQSIQHAFGIRKAAGDVLANSSFLAAQYLNVPNVLPALSANMMNPWFFVAMAKIAPGSPIYSVPDTSALFGIRYRTIGLVLFLAAAVFIVRRISVTRKPLHEKVVLSLCVVPILLPFLATSAHEAHFFFGFISTIVIGFLLHDRQIQKFGYLISLLLAANLVLINILMRGLPEGLMVVPEIPLAFASTIIFFALLRHLLLHSYEPMPIKSNVL